MRSRRSSVAPRALGRRSRPPPPPLKGSRAPQVRSRGQRPCHDAFKGLLSLHGHPVVTLTIAFNAASLHPCIPASLQPCIFYAASLRPYPCLAWGRYPSSCLAWGRLSGHYSTPHASPYCTTPRLTVRRYCSTACLTLTLTASLRYWWRARLAVSLRPLWIQLVKQRLVVLLSLLVDEVRPDAYRGNR